MLTTVVLLTALFLFIEVNLRYCLTCWSLSGNVIGS